MGHEVDVTVSISEIMSASQFGSSVISGPTQEELGRQPDLQVHSLLDNSGLAIPIPVLYTPIMELTQKTSQPMSTAVSTLTPC